MGYRTFIEGNLLVGQHYAYFNTSIERVREDFNKVKAFLRNDLAKDTRFIVTGAGNIYITFHWFAKNYNGELDSAVKTILSQFPLCEGTVLYQTDSQPIFLDYIKMGKRDSTLILSQSPMRDSDTVNMYPQME